MDCHCIDGHHYRVKYVVNYVSITICHMNVHAFYDFIRSLVCNLSKPDTDRKTDVMHIMIACARARVCIHGVIQSESQNNLTLIGQRTR